MLEFVYDQPGHQSADWSKAARHGRSLTHSGVDLSICSHVSPPRLLCLSAYVRPVDQRHDVTRYACPTSTHGLLWRRSMSKPNHPHFWPLDRLPAQMKYRRPAPHMTIGRNGDDEWSDLRNLILISPLMHQCSPPMHSLDAVGILYHFPRNAGGHPPRHDLKIWERENERIRERKREKCKCTLAKQSSSGQRNALRQYSVSMMISNHMQ